MSDAVREGAQREPRRESQESRSGITGGTMTAMAALYQRARPATFAEVVGQEHVKDVLLAALERGQTSHAYLFSGPRGVGKTTTARLLAMALNCEAKAGAPKPCGECDGCRMVREGHHPDVIELDAASNNSVDDVRDLREKTTLASMRGGTRVWILDEAHMLSKAAANALLKTLEEPPPGLVFILATTEPEKLPPTVLSRCQHFRFRRHTEAEILGKLERLCSEAFAQDGSEAGVVAEPEALALLARAADGAMRDAESLLERLLTPGRAITLTAAEDALGLPPVHRMQRLARALVGGDISALLTEAEGLYRDGFAPRSLAENLGTVLRDALRAEVIGVAGAGADVGANGSGEPFRLQIAREDLLRAIHALDDEQERFIRRDDLYSLEVALLKTSNALTGNRPADFTYGTPGDESPRPLEGAAHGSGRAPGTPAPEDSGRSQRTPAATEPEQDDGLPSFDPTGRGPAPAPRAAPGGKERNGPATQGGAGSAQNVAGSAATGTPGEAPRKLDWHAVRSAAGPQLKAFLIPARESVEGNDVVIRYAETHKFHFNELKKRQDELIRLIEEVGGPGYRIRIEGPGDPATKKR